MTGNKFNGNGARASGNETPKIAIVGMAAMFPGETGTTGFWRTIARGEDAIGEIPPHYWNVEDYYDPDPAAPDKTYCNRGAFIGKVAFDTLKFGVPPTMMKATDTVQLLALMTASEVLSGVEKSQGTPIDKSRTGVVLGVASATELCVHMGSRLQRPIWANALREHGMSEEDVTAICDRISDHFVPWQEASFPGLLGNVAAGRIANRLDITGPNFVTDAACASSLSALQVGLSQLYLGETDLVIAGGVDALNDILMFMCFSKTPVFSRTGDCRPFSDQADGTILGEGLAMFALRRLEDAERDGNEIYAVIRGVGAASDGRAISVYAPRPEGQALAIERAYVAAGYSPSTVEMIEAHGTGTKAGDAGEFAGLCLALGKDDSVRRQSIALGSVKSQIGHSKAAAGAAGLFKAAMALHHGVLPPTLKVDRPNPNLKIDESPFYLNTELRPWIRGKGHPRRAGVSAFGFGGANYHVTLEEYVGPGKKARRRRHHDCELVLLSAATPAELERALTAAVERAGSVDLSRVAFEAQTAFNPAHACRLSLTASSTKHLGELAELARAQIAENRPGLVTQNRPGQLIKSGAGQVVVGRLDLAPAETGRVGFLFPGQGSQYVGMGGGVATAFERARQVWDRAADVIAVEGLPLHDAVFPAPVFTDEARAAQEARLTRLEIVQPAIAATEASMLALLGALGVRAHYFAGHSFGEVMALHAAGAFGYETALKIAAERGRLMAEAAKATKGGMLAVQASREAVEKLIAELNIDLVIANDNSPQQVVLSGQKAAILAAEAALRQRGLTVTVLPVATGSHSPIVAGCCGPFRNFLAGQSVVAPGHIVYANATASPYPNDARSTADVLAEQLGQGVRFRESIERMYQDGVRVFIEVGPGGVLTNLVRQCLGTRPHRAISLDRRGAKGLAAFWQGIGEIALACVPVDLPALWDEAPAEPEVKRPSGAHIFEIDGVNVGKPYPARKVQAGQAAAPPTKPIASQQTASAPVAVVTAPQDNQSLFASFQALLDEQRKHLETTLMNAHRSYVETSSAAFFAAIGVEHSVSPAMLAASPAPIPGPAPAAPVVMERPAPTPAVAPVVKPPPVATPAPVAKAPEPVAVTVRTEVLRLVEVVVSEKTGYPPEVLGHDMDLEAELGIDSIKQVEILSALRERMPGLPEIEPSALAQFRTIAAIAAMIGGHAPAKAAVVAGPAPTPVFIDAPPLAPEVLPVEPTPAAPGNDALLRLVEAIVSEKTGYPAEVLGHEMDLEAELGIDSIKQVEILSALRDRMPSLPEIEPSALAQFRTIGAIATMIGGHAPAPAAQPALSAPAPAPVAIVTEVVSSATVAVSTPTVGGNDALLRLVEAIVSEKTGYPAEVLGPDMDLEAELGIDSIKQVEILSALRDRMPELPEIEPSALAQYRTIGAIATMIGGHAPAPAPTPTPPPPAASAAAPLAAVVTEAVSSVTVAVSAPAGVSLLRLVEAIVSEKTGYPAEVLGPDMDLEAELGIDSIKQVEILSALRDRMPELPEIEPSALAQYRTIGAIATMIGGHAPASAPTPPAGLAPVVAIVTEAMSSVMVAVSAPASAGNGSLLRLVEAIVSEKTGYPAEVLGPDMDLEAELGIDSIKQVEILSALRDRIPGLPEIEPSALAQYRTIGAIATMIARQTGPTDVPPTPPGASAPMPVAPKVATNPLTRELYELVASPATGLIPAGVVWATSVNLVGGTAALQAELTRRFEERGVAVTDAPSRMLIFLGGLDGNASPERALGLHREAFLAAKSAAAAFGGQGGAFITVQDCGGDFGYGGASPARTWFSGVPGLVKTAAREWPAADVRAIDIAVANRTPDAVADLIVAELYAGGPEIEVAYDAAGLRRVPVRRNRPLDRLAGLPLADGDVVIVTGGARGVTAAAATALAKEKCLRLCLLGRSPVLDEVADLVGANDEVALRQRLVVRATAKGQYPDLLAIRREASQVLASREVVATLAAIRAAGSEARYIRCDVNDAASVAAAIAEIHRDFGSVAGLIHGAGVIADKAIAEKTVADFESVYRTKVGAFATLLNALGQDSLRVLCNFSSVAAKFGNNGQSDYAMANETLNKLAIAHARANPRCRVKSICWGPWEGGMVDPSLKRRFEKAGIGMIAFDAGGLALVEELSSDDGAVEVVLREGDFLPEHPARMTIDLDPARYAYLIDHRVTEDAVLPVVIVQEWFARATRLQVPDASSLSVENLSVLKGVVLSGFPAQRHRFGIEIEAVAGARGAFALKLRDADGQPRYTARVVAHDHRAATIAPAVRAVEKGPLQPAAVYGDHRLFHGPAFQTLHRVGPMTDEGSTAAIGSTHDRGWPGSTWAADPAAIDGCLQLARLWAFDRSGSPSLPGRIGSCRIIRQAQPGQVYECTMWSRVVDGFRSEHDIDLMLDGELAIALSGVEMYRTRAGAAA